MRLRNMPTRLATGAYILHSGVTKFGGGPELAAGVHGMAAGAFPVLKSIEPLDFLRALSIGEVTTGAALLAPFVPNRFAGALLTGFSGGLVTMYLRTPALRNPGSIWPNDQGTAVSKDAWMLGIGLGLLLDSARKERKG
ncbi:MAG: hypothetical protein ACRDQA_21755 [Nocardioidaceae bacterium]